MRNCRGYIFRLQKQSERNFLAFAPECGPMCRADEALRRGLLLEETRREAAATSQRTQTHTCFSYGSQTDHVCRAALPCQRVVRIHNKAQGAEQVYKYIQYTYLYIDIYIYICVCVYTVRVCARVCVDIIKCFVLYCAHTITRW